MKFQIKTRSEQENRSICTFIFISKLKYVSSEVKITLILANMLDGFNSSRRRNLLPFD